jgi:exodeoxyribonuclease VII large subunit
MPEPQSPTANIPEYSVSELSFAVKRTVEERFGLVRVKGEISGAKLHSSGHLYLSLKDDKSVLAGVMWKGSVSGLRFRPEDGLEVICTGRLTTYPGQSKYQIVIERMEPAGVGALMAMLEERKKRLAAEGLFAAERKRALPFLPRVIGVITSPTGAVIRDILHRLADRFPRHVLVWPVAVQGEGAAEQVANAIAGFNAMTENRPDVLIVARGGGSLEDLWAFNEEVVVRAAASSQIPLISAVGHETDTTLIDFASDRRAPTPTAAAEMAVPVKADLDFTVGDLGLRLERGLARGLAQRGEAVRGLARGLPHPRQLLGLAQQRFDELADRLPRSWGAGVTVWRGRLDRTAARLSVLTLANRLTQSQQVLNRLGADLVRARTQGARDRAQNVVQAARLLETLSYKATLKRGYAVVRDGDGHVLAQRDAAAAAPALAIEFQDGVLDLTGKPQGTTSKKANPPGEAQGGRQGSLL